MLRLLLRVNAVGLA